MAATATQGRGGVVRHPYHQHVGVGGVQLGRGPAEPNPHGSAIRDPAAGPAASALGNEVPHGLLPPAVDVCMRAPGPDSSVTVEHLEGGYTEVVMCGPDQTGLGCNLTRCLLEFGLCCDNGYFTVDRSTAGSFFHIVFRVHTQRYRNTDWESFKARVRNISITPVVDEMLLQGLRDASGPGVEAGANAGPALQTGAEDGAPKHLLFRVKAKDKRGMLNAVAQTLTESGLIITSARVSTSPSEEAVELFEVRELESDGTSLALSEGFPRISEQRADDVCRRVREALKQPGICCQFATSNKPLSRSPDADVGGGGGGVLGLVATSGSDVMAGHSQSVSSSSCGSDTRLSWQDDEDSLGASSRNGYRESYRDSRRVRVPGQKDRSLRGSSSSDDDEESNDARPLRKPTMLEQRVAEMTRVEVDQSTFQHLVCLVRTVDRKGLLYDVMRAAKAHGVHVAHSTIRTIPQDEVFDCKDFRLPNGEAPLFAETDMYLIEPTGDELEDEGRISELSDTLFNYIVSPVLTDICVLEERGPAAPGLPPAKRTVLTVRSELARPGVLQDATSALALLNLSVINGNINAWEVMSDVQRGSEVVLVIGDEYHNPILDPARLEEIRETVHAHVVGYTG